MHVNYKLMAILLAAGGIFPVNTYAQKKIPSTFMSPSILEKMERSIAQASSELRMTPRVRDFNVYKSAPGYGLVLGYETPLTQKLFHPDLGLHTGLAKLEPNPVVQVAPRLQRSIGADASKAIKRLDELTLPEITQAIYLWRLANPLFITSENSLLGKRAGALVDQYWQDNKGMLDSMEELPNITFLRRLMNPSFKPQTYAQLAEQTKVYPKHVTLNEVGFPVPAAEAEQASLLDNYLMLAEPRMMAQFDTSSLVRGKAQYTPFVLTREERKAADQLLALRQESVKIPQRPTIRQLLEIAYNQLESHTVPYNTSHYSVGSAFPEYEHTQLHHTIKDLMNQMEGSVWRESRDMSHLIVLDAVMGGLADHNEWQNVSHINRALDAFEKLCKETPLTAQNEKHLAQLHQSLLEASGFWEYLPGNMLKREDFDQLTIEELTFLQERVRQFAELNVHDLMRP